MTEQAQGERRRVCHYCELPIPDDERAIQARTKNAWAHFECWYEGGPFERDMRERAEAQREQLPLSDMGSGTPRGQG